MSTHVFLVRHGESLANMEARFGGYRTCRGLSPRGRLQAGALRERLRKTQELNGSHIVSSTFPRALETAEIIAPSVCRKDIDARVELGAMDPGPTCDGMTFEDFVSRFGKIDLSVDTNRSWFPDGESLSDFHSRVIQSLYAIENDYRNSRVILTCHGGTIDRALCHCLNLDIATRFETSTKPTSVTEIVIEQSGPWRLLRFNDHAHLAELN